MIGFIAPGRVRGQVFTEEWLKTNFGDVHKTATGEEIKKGGYPDVGSGVYSNKLSYADWYKFNNAQRAHQNYLEFAPSTYAFLLIGGIYFPIPSAAIGLGIFIARIIYAYGYVAGGPNGRLIGALANDVFILALFVLSIISSIYWIQGNQILGQTNSQ